MLKTVLKYGTAAAAGAIAATMFSEETKKDIGKAVAGVKGDVTARAKKVGSAVKKWWEESVEPGPKPPIGTKPPVEPKDTPPPAGA